MSFLLSCPNCGPREVTDFAYGGEVAPEPEAAGSARELNASLYMRRNVAGPQLEWWYHRSGCRSWFEVERDTRTNEVSRTALPHETDAGRAASALTPTDGPVAGRGVQ